MEKSLLSEEKTQWPEKRLEQRYQRDQYSQYSDIYEGRNQLIVSFTIARVARICYIHNINIPN